MRIAYGLVSQRRLLRIATATLLLVVPWPAQSEAPASRPATLPATSPSSATAVDPAAAEKVNALIDKLADPDWKNRKKAADELERLGEAADPALRESLARKDLLPDARTTIEVLLKQAAERKRTGATLVTLDLDQVEPLKAIAAILGEGDLVLADESRELLAQKSSMKIDVRLDRQPLFSALAKVGKDVGVGFTGLNDSRVVLAPLDSRAGDRVAGPSADEGPFVLCVQRIEQTIRKVRDFAGVRGGGGNPMLNAFTSPPLRVSVAAWAEPRIKPGVWMLDSLSDCTTDKGKALTGQLYSYGRNARTNDGSSTFITLTGDTEGATEIVAMTVKARFVLNWNTEVFEVDNLQAGQEVTKVIAGTRVVLQNLRKVNNTDTWSFEVVIHRDNRAPEDWAALQQIVDRQGCRVVDKDGKALQQRGSGSSWGGNELRVNGTVSQANGAGEPKKLTWELPGKIETLPATFIYKNIPLP